MMTRKILALQLAFAFASAAIGAHAFAAPDRQDVSAKPPVVETPKAAAPRVAEGPSSSHGKATPVAAGADIPEPLPGEMASARQRTSSRPKAVVHLSEPSARKASSTPLLDVPLRRDERISLPGVGALPGAKTTIPQDVVRAVEGKNQVVAVSSAFANRIATPFATPTVFGIYSEKQVTIKPVGQSLFVQFKTDEPLALYITGSTPGDPVISLTLVPQPIPAQTVLVQIDENAHSAPLAAAEADRKDPASYTDKLVSTLRAAALGHAPAGFVEAPLPKATGRIGELIVTPEVRYSNAVLDVYRYRIQSSTPDPIELDEASFDAEGVRAVAFFPSGKVRPGEFVSVFVVSDKTAGAAHE